MATIAQNMKEKQIKCSKFHIVVKVKSMDSGCKLSGICAPRNMNKNVITAVFVIEKWNLETTQIVINRRMSKQSMVHSYSGELYSDKNGHTIWMNVKHTRSKAQQNTTVHDFPYKIFKNH